MKLDPKTPFRLTVTSKKGEVTYNKTITANTLRKICARAYTPHDKKPLKASDLSSLDFYGVCTEYAITLRDSKGNTYSIFAAERLSNEEKTYSVRGLDTVKAPSYVLLEITPEKWEQMQADAKLALVLDGILGRDVPRSAKRAFLKLILEQL